MKSSSFRWAFKIFILSISLSIVFSVISQSLFPRLSVFVSLFVIAFFVFVSTVFDMVAVAVTSTNIQNLANYQNEKEYKMAIRLVENTEKIASFCGDVVGDICSILSGAGGVSLVLNMGIVDPNVNFITTCIVSSLIAGLTIFCKAVMKTYAVKNAEKVMLKTASIMTTSPLARLKAKWEMKRKKGKNKKRDDLMKK